MTEAVKPVMNIADVPLSDNAHGEAFQAKIGSFGRLIGSSGMGVMLHVVEPGKKAFPFHAHHMTQELFVILEGEGTYRFGSESYPVRAGTSAPRRPAGRGRPPDRQHRQDDAEVSRHLGQSDRHWRRGRVSGFGQVRRLRALRPGDWQGRRALHRPRRDLARLLGRRVMAAWFKPHRYGIGATPTTWQGWLLVAAYAAIVLGAMWIVLPHQGPLEPNRLAVWLVIVAAASAVIIWVAHRTTEGGWHWRWGDRHRGTN